ncbi:MAG: helix-turn-helix domain-containing protein [bacterium]
MSEKVDTTIALLTQFGVSQIEAKTYLEILSGRGDTALQLSRNLKVARTKVYRILDNLIARGLVITRLGERGTKFSTLAPDRLDLLISDREHELDKLKSMLPTLQSELSELSLRGETPKSQVLYYHGLDGLKQVTYNSLRAKGELLTYELSTMNAFLSKKEAEELRRKFVANKITSRTLTSATSLKAWTDVSEIVTKYWDIRHLDKPFQFEILIYNDVYCMYRYSKDDIFCVEIHSQELADMQRQIFEYLWSGAKKFKVLDNHGAAILL